MIHDGQFAKKKRASFISTITGGGGYALCQYHGVRAGNTNEVHPDSHIDDKEFLNRMQNLLHILLL